MKKWFSSHRDGNSSINHLNLYISEFIYEKLIWLFVHMHVNTLAPVVSQNIERVVQ